MEVIRAKEEKHVVGKGTLTLRIIKHHDIKACGGMEVYLHTLSLTGQL